MFPQSTKNSKPPESDLYSAFVPSINYHPVTMDFGPYKREMQKQLVNLIKKVNEIYKQNVICGMDLHRTLTSQTPNYTVQTPNYTVFLYRSMESLKWEDSQSDVLNTIYSLFSRNFMSISESQALETLGKHDQIRIEQEKLQQHFLLYPGVFGWARIINPYWNIQIVPDKFRKNRMDLFNDVHEKVISENGKDKFIRMTFPQKREISLLLGGISLFSLNVKRDEFFKKVESNIDCILDLIEKGYFMDIYYDIAEELLFVLGNFLQKINNPESQLILKERDPEDWNRILKVLKKSIVFNASTPEVTVSSLKKLHIFLIKSTSDLALSCLEDLSYLIGSSNPDTYQLLLKIFNTDGWKSLTCIQQENFLLEHIFVLFFKNQLELAQLFVDQINIEAVSAENQKRAIDLLDEFQKCVKERSAPKNSLTTVKKSKTQKDPKSNFLKALEQSQWKTAFNALVKMDKKEGYLEMCIRFCFKCIEDLQDGKVIELDLERLESWHKSNNEHSYGAIAITYYVKYSLFVNLLKYNVEFDEYQPENERLLKCMNERGNCEPNIPQPFIQQLWNNPQITQEQKVILWKQFNFSQQSISFIFNSLKDIMLTISDPNEREEELERVIKKVLLERKDKYISLEDFENIHKSIQDYLQTDICEKENLVHRDKVNIICAAYLIKYSPEIALKFLEGNQGKWSAETAEKRAFLLNMFLKDSCRRYAQFEVNMERTYEDKTHLLEIVDENTLSAYFKIPLKQRVALKDIKNILEKHKNSNTLAELFLKLFTYDAFDLRQECCEDLYCFSLEQLLSKTSLSQTETDQNKTNELENALLFFSQINENFINNKIIKGLTNLIISYKKQQDKPSNDLLEKFKKILDPIYLSDAFKKNNENAESFILAYCYFLDPQLTTYDKDQALKSFHKFILTEDSSIILHEQLLKRLILNLIQTNQTAEVKQIFKKCISKYLTELIRLFNYFSSSSDLDCQPALLEVFIEHIENQENLVSLEKIKMVEGFILNFLKKSDLDQQLNFCWNHIKYCLEIKKISFCFHEILDHLDTLGPQKNHNFLEKATFQKALIMLGEDGKEKTVESLQKLMSFFEPVFELQKRDIFENFDSIEWINGLKTLLFSQSSLQKHVENLLQEIIQGDEIPEVNKKLVADIWVKYLCESKKFKSVKQYYMEDFCTDFRTFDQYSNIFKLWMQEPQIDWEEVQKWRKLHESIWIENSEKSKYLKIYSEFVLKNYFTKQPKITSITEINIFNHKKEYNCYAEEFDFVIDMLKENQTYLDGKFYLSILGDFVKHNMLTDQIFDDFMQIVNLNKLNINLNDNSELGLNDTSEVNLNGAYEYVIKSYTNNLQVDTALIYLGKFYQYCLEKKKSNDMDFVLISKLQCAFLDKIYNKMFKISLLDQYLIGLGEGILYVKDAESIFKYLKFAFKFSSKYGHSFSLMDQLNFYKEELIGSSNFIKLATQFLEVFTPKGGSFTSIKNYTPFKYCGNVGEFFLKCLPELKSLKSNSDLENDKVALISPLTNVILQNDNQKVSSFNLVELAFLLMRNKNFIKNEKLRAEAAGQLIREILSASESDNWLECYMKEENGEKKLQGRVLYQYLGHFSCELLTMFLNEIMKKSFEKKEVQDVITDCLTFSLESKNLNSVVSFFLYYHENQSVLFKSISKQFFVDLIWQQLKNEALSKEKITKDQAHINFVKFCILKSFFAEELLNKVGVNIEEIKQLLPKDNKLNEIYLKDQTSFTFEIMEYYAKLTGNKRDFLVLLLSHSPIWKQIEQPKLVTLFELIIDKLEENCFPFLPQIYKALFSNRICQDDLEKAMDQLSKKVSSKCNTLWKMHFGVKWLEIAGEILSPLHKNKNSYSLKNYYKYFLRQIARDFQSYNSLLDLNSNKDYDFKSLKTNNNNSILIRVKDEDLPVCFFSLDRHKVDGLDILIEVFAHLIEKKLVPSSWVDEKNSCAQALLLLLKEASEFEDLSFYSVLIRYNKEYNKEIFNLIESKLPKVALLK